MHIGYLKAGPFGLSMLATNKVHLLVAGSIWSHVYTLLHLVTNIHPPPSKTPGSICKPLNFYIG